MINSKIKNLVIFFIIFLTSFIAGYNFYSFASDKQISLYLDKLNFVKKYQDLQKNTVGINRSSIFLKKDLELENFWKAYNLILKNYYNANELNKEKLVYGAIKGLVESMGDKFSEFLTPEENKEFSQSLSGDFEGIGAVVDKNEMGVLVDRVIKGSPALKNDIRKGDIIIKANDIDLSKLSLFEAVAKIKGPASTKVNLVIFRPGEKELLKKEVIREKITIPSVDFKVLDNTNIGYIAINIFGENTASEFNTALYDLKSKKVSGIIIDLRNNGGGFLQSAVDILSNFIPKGKLLVTTKYKDSFLNNYYYSDNIGEVVKLPIVVLINENTASASEITAGALRDYNLAIITGKKSYGKGSVQEPFDMGDGSMLKLTIAKWYTPKDYNIDKQGINPDIEIDFKKEDIEKKYDRQLEESKKILEKFISIGNIAATIEYYKKENNLNKKNGQN